jgi:hypothetical protein
MFPLSLRKKYSKQDIRAMTDGERHDLRCTLINSFPFARQALGGFLRGAHAHLMPVHAESSEWPQWATDMAKEDVPQPGELPFSVKFEIYRDLYRRALTIVPVVEHSQSVAARRAQLKKAEKLHQEAALKQKKLPSETYNFI